MTGVGTRLRVKSGVVWMGRRPLLRPWAGAMGGGAGNGGTEIRAGARSRSSSSRS